MQETLKKNVATRVKKMPEPRMNGRITPWIWVAPSVLLLAIFLVYPTFNTIWLSFYDRYSIQFVGLKNYQEIFTDPTMLGLLSNNLLWLVLGTIVTVGLGLIIATLVDRVKFEGAVKAVIFIPMAISFVGAGVIWKFVYTYEPANQPQSGILNAVLTAFKAQPQAWLINPAFNNLALIAVYVWMWTGFCMVILSAAIKGIPTDIMEAARADGANEFTIFFRITVPMISPTIAVVATTEVINLLKIFDIIYVMTGGNYNTNVVAMSFYMQIFDYNNYGLGSALSVLLLLVIIPIMYVNIRRFRAEEAQR
jgi:alpha-glucoside transport system permease protein